MKKLMKLKVGLKFQNDKELCEVRGIVDECQIVLFCENELTNRKKYKLIDVIQFDNNILNEVFEPCPTH